MRGLPCPLLLSALLLVACTGGSHRGASAPPQQAGSNAPQTLAATPRSTPIARGTPGPSFVAAVPGMQDIGQFLVSAAGLVHADNRAATTLLHLAAGDEIRIPSGMLWDAAPPIGGGSPPGWISAAVRVSGHRLHLALDALGTVPGLASVEQIDDRTYTVSVGGTALLWANEDSVFSEGGTLADYPIAVDSAGHLWLAPLPISANLVVDYPSGTGLDMRSMKPVGWLPSAGRTGAFFFTTCNPQRCDYTDRLAGPLTAPFAGTLSCRSGTNFDLVGDGFRLRFRDAATLLRPGNATPTSTPGPDCGPGLPIKSGQEIDDTGAHYVVSAVSAAGEPLSVVVANDGTLYVGHLAVPPLDGPGRAT